jgi:hypothetical protein
MIDRMRSVFPGALVLVLVMLPAAIHAAVDARVNVTLESDNWYPIPEGQMKSAVMDSALDVLTEQGDISLQAEADDSVASELNGHLSLVGAASQVSFTLELLTSGEASHVATSSISIEGLGREEIYQSLGYIGREVGTRLSERLSVNESSTGGEVSDELAALFERGRELKREGRFDEARQAFVEVQARTSNEEWAGMAADELDYGLLIHEARSLMNNLGNPATPMNERKDMARLAGNRLREAIARNNTHAARVRESQNLLDRVDMVITALDNAMQAQLMSQATPLRLTIMESYNMRGECITKERLEQYMGNRRSSDLTVASTRGTTDDRYYTLTSETLPGEVTLRCANGEVTLER